MTDTVTGEGWAVGTFSAFGSGPQVSRGSHWTVDARRCAATR